MKSFAYSEDGFDSVLCYQIWYEVMKLRLYFRKFSKDNADEAMQMTIMHAMTHYLPSKGDLVPYIKTLAREITKDNGKMISCDFLEQTLSKDNDEQSSGVRVDLGEVADISDSVVENIILSTSRREEIVGLALSFMDFFMVLCESLQTKNTSTEYFPAVFIRECLTLSKKCKNFNNECLSLYMSYKDKFTEFLNSGKNDIGVWRETDCDMVSKNVSKRVKLINKSGEVCEDPDVTPWTVRGNYSGKIIVKVPYYEIWDMMCDLIDADEINAMKFTIDFSYIIKTLGGSLSVVDPVLMNEYELCRLEILTNLLHDLGGRHLAIGSKCMYFLVDENFVSGKDRMIPKRVIRGITLDFKAYDVTPEQHNN